MTYTIPAGAFTIADSFALNEFISEQQPDLQQCLQFVEDRGVEMSKKVRTEVKCILEFANYTPQRQEADPTELVTVCTTAADVTRYITALEAVVDADAISDVRVDQTLNEFAGQLQGVLDARRLQRQLDGVEFVDACPVRMERGVLEQFIAALKHTLGLLPSSAVVMENKSDLGMLLGVLQVTAMS